MVTELMYPEASLSLNEIRGMNSHAYKALLKTYQWTFRALTNHRHPGRVRLEFFRMGPGILDYDNLVGGGKPMLDALKRAEIIKDDRPKIIAERHYDQVRVAPNDCKTIIRIIDLD